MATVACGAGDDDSGSGDSAVTAAQIGAAFDVNDVSILLPLKKTADGKVPYPQIRVSGVAPPGADVAPAAQQLWTAEVWSQVIAEAERQGIESGATGNDDFFKLRGLWHVAGMRFDPCAPGFDDSALAAVGGKCVIQFRLIVQPFTTKGNGASDFTAHLVYTLGTADKATLAQNPTVQGAVKMLAQIKDAASKVPGHAGDTAGAPLGVHPGLQAEAAAGQGTQVADLVRNLVKTFATGPSRAVAFMGLQNGGPEPWTFFFGQVQNNTFAIQNGPAHGQKAQTLQSGKVLTKSLKPINTSPLFDIAADQLTPDQRQLAFKVENPKTQNFFNTDCISCHTSSARTNEIPLGDKAEISARTPVPANITGYVRKAEAQDDVWNVRNFGYFFEKPTVSGRTVTETVDVVQWLNKNVVAPGSGLNGPGRDCSKVDADVFRCFRDGKDHCFATCGGAPQPTSDTPSPAPVALSIDPTAPSSQNEPCLNASVGGAPTVAVTNLALLQTVGLTLGGNDSACLSRVLGGAFAGNGAVLSCNNPGSCIVTLAQADTTDTGVKVASLKGDDQIRFRQFFRVQDDSYFETRAPGGSALRIQCIADRCAVMVAIAPVTLPAPPSTITRLNP
jgi:hypothetical protein